MSIYLFDAYGTLLDVNAAANTLAHRLGGNAARVSELWRAKQLEYTWIRTLTGLPFADFEVLTSQALTYTFDKLEIKDPQLYADLLALYLKLDAFSEVPEILTKLKAEGHQLAILSNGSEKMLNAACDHARITQLFTHIFSVDTLRKYKTSPEVYQMACDQFKVTPNEITFFSSNRWDVAAAQNFGYKTVWVNRANNPDEYLDAAPDRVVKSLKDYSTQ